MGRWMTLIVVAALAPLVSAQELFIYPAEGQSQDQQDMDSVITWPYPVINNPVHPVNPFKFILIQIEPFAFS